MDDERTPYTPVITDQMDLEDLWHELMGRLGFAAASLWLLVIGPDDRPLPQLVEVTGVDELPAPSETAVLADTLRRTAEGLPAGIRVAFLRSRPGTDAIGLADRQWAALLYAAAREAGVACATVHAANDVRLVPVPWDDLPLTRPA